MLVSTAVALPSIILSVRLVPRKHYIDEQLKLWARRKLNIDMLLDALKNHVVACSVCRLKCMDPPAVTTGQLYDLGYSQYDVRTFWGRLSLGSHTLVVYTIKNGYFSLEFEHSIGKVQEIYCVDSRIPVDDFDAERRETIFTPNSHRLYIRLLGYLGGNEIRINVVRIAKLVESYEPGLPEKFIDTVRNVIWKKEDREALLQIIYGELERWRNIIELLIPHFPDDLNHLRLLMPVFRRSGSL